MNPSFKPSPHPKMPNIQVFSNGTGFLQLLKGLNPHKAAGPDQLKPIVLQTVHKELAPILKLIFQKSLDTGRLPSIWKKANVSPICKKGNKTEPANYRPISLTCVLCKVLEHVVASGISKHFTEKIFFQNCNMGFWKRGPARHNSLCLLMNCPKVCNPVNKLQSCSRSIIIKTPLLRHKGEHSKLD